jgi:hypothetical protein
MSMQSAAVSRLQNTLALALVCALWTLAGGVTATAQSRLSPDDQSRFDSYYSRWMDYTQRNDRDQMASMEGRMRDIYARYNIPMNTPFWRVATNGRQWRGRQRWNLSADDQQRFDSYFSRWQEYQQRNDRDQMRSMEGRMQDIYRHYNIPGNTPYFRVASNARDEDWDRWERDRWRGRLSAEDQSRFDSYYGRWQDYQRDRNRGQIESMEKRMYDIYDHYQIPRQVPFEQIASR